MQVPAASSKFRSPKFLRPQQTFNLTQTNFESKNVPKFKFSHAGVTNYQQLTPYNITTTEADILLRRESSSIPPPLSECDGVTTLGLPTSSINLKKFKANSNLGHESSSVDLLIEDEVGNVSMHKTSSRKK